MTVEDALAHKWLGEMHRLPADPVICEMVMKNMKQFSQTGEFFSLCVASVAKQLDHHRLQDVHKVFCDMDQNGDGVLSLKEVKDGFKKTFGADNPQIKDVEEMFDKLDLDGSGTIDFTEFCAAGIGERISTEEEVLWAAFKSFDVDDDDGKISKEEIAKVLSSVDVGKVWTTEVCQAVTDEIFQLFEGKNAIDFNDWLRLMRECAGRHHSEASMARTPEQMHAFQKLDDPYERRN
jgi:calcium-dependent protein kinase